MAAALAKKDVRVKSIFVYPIKSCRGISVAEAPISPTGFRWDRQWMVVDSGGRAITQRVEPKLALVQTQLPHQAFSLHWQPNNHSFLEIKAPGMEVVKVPLVRSSASSEKEKVVDGISVWEWCGSAVDEGAAAAQWFSNYLAKPTRLVRFNQASKVRNVEAEYAPGYSVMFADMYPFLLLSQGSMDALNALLKEPIPVNRFRPKWRPDAGEEGMVFAKILSDLEEPPAQLQILSDEQMTVMFERNRTNYEVHIHITFEVVHPFAREEA